MYIALVFIGFFAMFATTDWKRGIYLTVLTAFLQDPLRKVLPGQPPVCIVFAAIVFAATTIGAFASNAGLDPARITGWRRHLRGPFWLFGFLVIIQSGNSLVRFENIGVTALGLLNYSLPLIALMTSYSFFAYGGQVATTRLLQFYTICCGAALFTVYLEWQGFQSALFGEVGEGVLVHFGDLAANGNTGTFRASEIAAWHSAMAACVVTILLTARRITAARVAVLAVLVTGCLVIGSLTGRRKMVVMVMIFGLSYVGIQVLLLRRTRLAVLLVTAFGVLLYAWQVTSLDADRLDVASRTGEYERYVRRNQTAFGEIPTRAVDLGLTPVLWAYNWFGWTGGGVGIGTQGVQHIADLGDHVGAAEGGLGRITLELGFPGLLAVGLLVYATSRHIWGVLLVAEQHSPAMTRLACGLTSILIANAASFSVATQAYGDSFIMILLGMILAALLAIPAMILKTGVAEVRILQTVQPAVEVN